MPNVLKIDGLAAQKAHEAFRGIDESYWIPISAEEPLSSPSHGPRAIEFGRLNLHCMKKEASS
jgi:hypothetical protein